MESEKDTYTTHELAKLMGRNVETIRRWARKGQIPGAEKWGNDWVIWKREFHGRKRRGQNQQEAA